MWNLSDERTNRAAAPPTPAVAWRACPTWLHEKHQCSTFDIRRTVYLWVSAMVRTLAANYGGVHQTTMRVASTAPEGKVPHPQCQRRGGGGPPPPPPPLLPSPHQCNLVDVSTWSFEVGKAILDRSSMEAHKPGRSTGIQCLTSNHGYQWTDVMGKDSGCWVGWWWLLGGWWPKMTECTPTGKWPKMTENGLVQITQLLSKMTDCTPVGVQSVIFINILVTGISPCTLLHHHHPTCFDHHLQTYPRHCKPPPETPWMVPG